MKPLPSSLRTRLLLLLAGVLACTTFTGCHEDNRRHVHRGYYDRDARHGRYDDRYRHDDVGYRGSRYRGTTVSGDIGGSTVVVHRDSPVVRERTYSY